MTMALPGRLLICATILLCFVHFGNTVPPVISFVPQSPLVLSSNDTQTSATGRTLAITCTQPTGGTLKSLILRRNSSSSELVRLMNANVETAPPDGTNGLPVIIGNIQGATPSGSLNQRSTTLTYSQASCDHTGMYSCLSTIFEGGQYLTFETYQSYSVTVGPGRATITITSEGIPSEIGYYMIGEVVILRCNVDVGTVESTSTKVDFVWQYEETAGSQLFLAYPNLDDIDNTESPTSGQRCQTQTRISKLRRNLTSEDSYRQYRCYISKGGQTYADLAGSADIPQVKSSDNEPVSGQNIATAKTDVGMIVGIVIAVLVVIAVVVVIVVFVIRHRKQREQEGAYEPEKPPEPISSVPPPYTSEPPRFSRTDKPRSGHTNKAMDDEHDGKEPEKEKERSKNRDRGDKDPDRERRYDGRQPRQEYETGKRNPAYERNVDDPRGRRYSSDDGGTDVNRSISLGEGDHTIGSAV